MMYGEFPCSVYALLQDLSTRVELSFTCVGVEKNVHGRILLYTRIGVEYVVYYIFSYECIHSSQWTLVSQTEDSRGSDLIKFTKGIMLDFSFEVPVKLKMEFRSGDGGSDGLHGDVRDNRDFSQGFIS